MKTLAKLLSILSLIPFLFSGCSGDSKGATNGKQPPVPVTVGTAVQKDVPVQIHAVGTVEAYSTVSIKPQVGGLLSKVYFKEGQDVKKGDLLFTIDPKPYQADLDQAQANLSADIAKAKNAREIANRYAELVKKDYVTEEQYEQYKTTAEALEASVDAEKAAVQNSRLQLNYATIRSPLTGRTGNLQIHEGNVVKANETMMIDIHQIHPVNIKFSVPGQQLPDVMKYKASNQLKVEAADNSGNPLGVGTLTFVDNGVDPSTATILLKGTFENANSQLWPGEFVNVTLTLTTRPNAIVVPTEAIETGQQGQYVFVIKADQTAEQRPIVAGMSVGEETVIESGLKAGETVVTDGQLRLLPGATVEVKKAGSAEAPAPAEGAKS